MLQCKVRVEVRATAARFLHSEAMAAMRVGTAGCGRCQPVRAGVMTEVVEARDRCRWLSMNSGGRCQCMPDGNQTTIHALKPRRCRSKNARKLQTLKPFPPLHGSQNWKLCVPTGGLHHWPGGRMRCPSDRRPHGQPARGREFRSASI